MICATCGMPNSTAARFCGRCSQPLAITGAGTTAPAQGPAAGACPRCGTSNAPDARFCGGCGLSFATAGAPQFAAAPAAVFPRAAQAQAWSGTPHKTGRKLPWALLVAIVGLAAAVLAVVAQLTMQQPIRACGVSCPPPTPPAPPLVPSGPPLPAPATFVSSALGFSVEYPPRLAPTTDAQSADWQLQANGDQFEIKIQGEAASGRTPQQITEALQQNGYGSASLVYTINGAELGYQSGYGNIYDAKISPAGGQPEELHVLIEVAVQNDVAVELIASSAFTPDKNDHAQPAQMVPSAVWDADAFGNSVLWKGGTPM